MFPSDSDVKAHKRAMSRINKQKNDFEQRAAKIGNPDQLLQFILDEAIARYRRGDRRIALTFSVPVVNFVDWALKTKVIGKTETEVYIKQLIRKPLLKYVRDGLKREIKPNILKSFECKAGGSTSYVFVVELSILNPK